MKDQIIIPGSIYADIGDLVEMILTAMADLSVAMDNGNLNRVAAHVVSCVAKQARSIKDDLRECIVEKGDADPFPIPGGCDMDEEAYKDELNLEDEIERDEYIIGDR